jgi:hypothetical protein
LHQISDQCRLFGMWSFDMTEDAALVGILNADEPACRRDLLSQ